MFFINLIMHKNSVLINTFPLNKNKGFNVRGVVMAYLHSVFC